MFVVNVDWFFESHRLPIARALLSVGAEVMLVTSVTDRATPLKNVGIQVVDLALSRSGKRPSELARAVRQLREIIRRDQPDLVHNITMKPVLAGSIAAASTDRDLPVVNAISGFGHLISDSEAGRFAPVLARTAYAAALRAPRRTAVIVQNRAALAEMGHQRLARRSDLALIPGMGVDTSRFRALQKHSAERPVVMLASRMIASKGIYEFAQAAILVRRRVPQARFVLVGPPDSGNPLSLSESDLRDIGRNHGIEWWGPSFDMASTLQKADVFVLPTYHEGLPKVLLEAAATELPIVASDIPGCREVVANEREALLVPHRDVVALSEAITRILLDTELARSLGAAARRRVEATFTVHQAVRAHLDIYSGLLS